MMHTGRSSEISTHSGLMAGGRWVALLVAAAIWCAPFGLAQEKKKSNDHTRSVQGVVTSADEKPVSGAVVQLKNTKTLQIRSFITQENGSYYFHELSSDVDYELKADFRGAASATKSLSSFDSRKEAILNLKLDKK
jgi:hypothetical protein